MIALSRFLATVLSYSKETKFISDRGLALVSASPTPRGGTPYGVPAHISYRALIPNAIWYRRRVAACRDDDRRRPAGPVKTALAVLTPA